MAGVFLEERTLEDVLPLLAVGLGLLLHLFGDGSDLDRAAGVDEDRLREAGFL